jgi:hypothetical protein
MKIDLASITRTLRVATLMAFLLLAPLPIMIGYAQTLTNTMPVAPAGHALWFHGKVTAVDPKAMTVSLNSLIVVVTSETKVTKNGMPAPFSQITIGEIIGGVYKKDAKNKTVALTLHIGAKNIGPTPAEDAGINLPATNIPPKIPTTNAVVNHSALPGGLSGTNIPSMVR